MSQLNLYFIRETQTQKSLKDKDIRNSIKYKLNIQYENHRSKQSCETISILVLIDFDDFLVRVHSLEVSGFCG